MKSEGPRVETRESRYKEVYKEEILLSHLSQKEQEQKKDVSCSRAVQLMPNQDKRGVSKTL